MLQIASWIRARDEGHFRLFLEGHPGLVVRNARVEPVDMETVSGLLVTGGSDIAAEFLNQPDVDASLIRNPDPVRDAWEFAAIRAAYSRGVPMLCICKGVQALNVVLGGTLHLDIGGHGRWEGESLGTHPLRYAGSARHRFETVNTSHHQALNRVADALEVEAWHAGDGVVEQVRVRDYPWGIGVQYHPERDSSYAGLFEDFIAQVRR
jgi:putative glutamine amidotransferase